MLRVDVAAPQRWELYRVLSEPARLRLLALAAEEELSIGELAELLHESQPNVSRHAGALRQAGLLSDRRGGARTRARPTTGGARDPRGVDALGSRGGPGRPGGGLAGGAGVVVAPGAPRAGV